ncbi:hypothetical protein [Chloroflexus sp.]|uniref:hypothetical protein n=1 Tax=Chloroflexus sp. TaxID=1904827 RepID=UPI004049373D
MNAAPIIEFRLFGVPRLRSKCHLLITCRDDLRLGALAEGEAMDREAYNLFASI